MKPAIIIGIFRSFFKKIRALTVGIWWRIPFRTGLWLTTRVLNGPGLQRLAWNFSALFLKTSGAYAESVSIGPELVQNHYVIPAPHHSVGRESN
jgi:hypothetical protein